MLGLTIVALVLGTWVPRLSGPIDLRWDGGVYYVLGTSLAEGKGYRLLNEPGEIRATQYPPALPALIALHQLAAGTEDPTVVGTRLRLKYLLLSVLLAIACFLLLRNYLASGWAFLGTCAFMLHTSTIFVSDIAFAELPFAVATVLFFIVLKRGSSVRSEIGAGALAVLAYLLRTTGIALMVAWVAEALLRRRLRLAAFRLMLALPVVVGWQLYIGAVERAPEYAATSYEYQRADYLFYNVSYGRNVTLRDPNRPELGKVSLSGLAERLVNNLKSAPRRSGETISAAREGWQRQISRMRGVPIVGKLFRPRLTTLALLFLGTAVLLGSARQFFTGEYAMPLYTFLSIGAISLTPWAHSGRYWFPLAPMMILGLYYFVTSADSLLRGARRRRFRRWRSHAVATGATVVLLVQAASLYDFFRHRHEPASYVDRRGETVAYRLFYYRDTYRALDAALDTLRAEAEPDAIVAASMPHWVYLRTGLTAIKPPFERDPARALALLESVPVRYLIVDGRSNSFTRVFGLPAVEHAPELWETVFLDEPGEVETFRRTHLHGRVARGSTP